MRKAVNHRTKHTQAVKSLRKYGIVRAGLVVTIGARTAMHTTFGDSNNVKIAILSAMREDPKFAEMIMQCGGAHITLSKQTQQDISYDAENRKITVNMSEEETKQPSRWQKLWRKLRTSVKL